jgi:hypothetical protein
VGVGKYMMTIHRNFQGKPIRYKEPILHLAIDKEDVQASNAEVWNNKEPP